VSPTSHTISRLIVLLTVAVAVAVALPVPSAAAAKAERAVTTLSGAPLATVDICGVPRPAGVAAVGDPLTASVRRSRRRGPRPVVVLERCDAGEWRTVQRLGRAPVRFPAPADGDYRLRARGIPGARAAYLRSGVGEIVDVPFRVDVRNQNRTASPCPPGAPDGGTYPVRGHITAPRQALAGAPSAALYYHGLSYGEFFWRFQAVPGYDTTRELARAGRVSVTVDRLGYGASTGPAGSAICYGSQADVAKQLVDALKGGTYQPDGATPVRFAKVALVGHSAGAFIGEIAAYSFPGIDALAMVSYGDAGASPLAITTAANSSLACVAGGEPQDEDGPPGYAYFGATPEDFRAAHLNAPTDPAVADAATAMRTRDPCGDLQSVTPALVVNQIGAQAISGPVLVLAGAQDALFPPPTVDIQAARMRLGGATVTAVTLDGTGHAITLGRTAPQFRGALNGWLAENGF